MAAMEAALAEAKAENERLLAMRDDPQAVQDSLQKAIDEFDSQFRVEVPGAKMQGPCLREDAQGNVCGRPWRAHLPPRPGQRAEVTGHTYREYPPDPPRPVSRGLYAREEGE